MATSFQDGVEPLSGLTAIEDDIQTWEVVGGADKGGILVREGQDMRSPQEQERLSTGALLRELELVGERLCFERLSGSGPSTGWVSLNLKDKPLVAKTSRQPTDAEIAAREAEKVLPPEVSTALAEAAAALKADAKFEAANDAFTAMAAVWGCKSARSQLLMARGLLLWRWSLLGKALAHLQEAVKQRAPGAPLVLLGLRLCLSQWPEARQAAEKLGRKDALLFIDHWESVCSQMQVFRPERKTDKTKLGTEDVERIPGIHSSHCLMLKSAQDVEANPGVHPSHCLMLDSVEDVEVLHGIRQTDFRVPTTDGAELGAHLLLNVDKAGEPATQQPLFLCFQRENEDVGSYLRKENSAFEPMQAAHASAIVIDYRGHGFSTGEADQKYLHADAEIVCDAIPGIFKKHSLPWPWPGGFVLFGSQLGSRVACYLAGMRGQLFDKGVVLETAWWGSNAPPTQAKPLQELPLLTAAQKRYKDTVWTQGTENAAADDVGCLSRILVEAAGAESIDAFCYLRGNEDLLRGFDGRLFIVHGERDTQIEQSYAQRLYDAAESARRTIRIIKGKGSDTLRADEQYKGVLQWFLGQMTDDQLRSRGL
eukprot:TRINITY_DN10775_c0_g1_i1.p1 TRINITY_DN10775_c0_g1~~TRINITY_DN10775_c0_g1_i1.p1  ORF type:complete len:595 (+),score=112.17 TRINITY_DN10775_c0_g1_i1:73-1857(+)